MWRQSQGVQPVSDISVVRCIAAGTVSYTHLDVYKRQFFRRLPPEVKEKVRDSGKVNKNRSKIDTSLRSHYRIAASMLTEEDVDSVERAGGFVLLGLPRSSKIPARYAAEDLASLCGWFVSEGNLIANEPRHYACLLYTSRCV